MPTNTRPAGRFGRTLPPGFKIRRRRFRSFAESLASGSRSGPLAADYDLARRAGEAIMPVVRAYRLSVDFSSGGRCRIENGSTLVLNALNAAQHNRLANLKTKLLGAIVAKGLPIYDLEIRVRPPKALPPASEPPKPAERIRSVTGARALRDEAARTADPEMRASLLALAEAVAPNAEERPGALLRGYRLELERAKAGAAAAAALEPALPSAPAESLIPNAADAAANPILEALRQKMLAKRERRTRLETPLVAAAAALEREAEEAGGILGVYFGAAPEAREAAAPASEADPQAESQARAGAGEAADALPPLAERELAALEEGLVSLHRRVTAALARMAEAARAIRADEREAARQAQAEREAEEAAEEAAAKAEGGESTEGAEAAESSESADGAAEAQAPDPRAAEASAGRLDAAEAQLAETEAAVAGVREALLPLLADSQRAADEASARLAPEDGAPPSEQSLERFAPLADAAAALRTTVRRRLDDADGLRRLLAEQKDRLAPLRALTAEAAEGAQAPDAARKSAAVRGTLAAVWRAAAALAQQGAQLAEEAETLADQFEVIKARLAAAVEAAELTPESGGSAAGSEPVGEDASPEEAAAEAARGERLAAEIERFKRAAALIPPGVDPKLIPDERDAAQDPERFALRLRLLARFDAHRHLDDLAAAASSLLSAADASRAGGFGIDPAMLDEAARATDALEEALAEAAENLHPAQAQPAADAAGEEEPAAAAERAEAAEAAETAETAASEAPAASAQDAAARLAADAPEGLEGPDAEALGALLLEASKRLAALEPKLPRAPDAKLVPPAADCRRGAHGRLLAETRARMLDRIERRRAFERALDALQGRAKALRARLSDGGPAAALGSEAASLLQDLRALERALDAPGSSGSPSGAS